METTSGQTIEFTPRTPLAPVEKPTLIIAMTARSGSTNLCSVLAKLGRLGSPQEYFNPRGPMALSAAKFEAKTASDYLAAAARQAEIFCFKVAQVDWRPFAARAKQLFPNARYVYLDRLDADAQAISLYRAKASQRWHARDTDRKAPPSAPLFDAAAIEACRQTLLAEKRRWADFFFEGDIKPLHIAYEHLVADMPKAVQMICREVDVRVARSEVPPGDYRILRDDLSERWIKRMRALRIGANADPARASETD